MQKQNTEKAKKKKNLIVKKVFQFMKRLLGRRKPWPTHFLKSVSQTGPSQTIEYKQKKLFTFILLYWYFTFAFTCFTCRIHFYKNAVIFFK